MASEAETGQWATMLLEAKVQMPSIFWPNLQPISFCFKIKLVTIGFDIAHAQRVSSQEETGKESTTHQVIFSRGQTFLCPNNHLLHIFIIG